LTTGLLYLADWSDLENAFYGKVRAWVLRGVVNDLVESVFAWRRGDELPAPSSTLTNVAEAWEPKQEQYEEPARAEEEDET